MAAEIVVPQGELATIGISPETSFGVKPSPFTTGAYWHCFKTFAGKIATQMVSRAPRASLADPYPGTGGRSGSGSLDVETDSDTFPQILAYALGAQNFDASNNVYSGTINAVMNSGATSATLTANQQTVHSVVPAVSLIYPGMTLTIGADTLKVATVDWTHGPGGTIPVTFTTGATATHTSGTAVVGAITKGVNIMTLGSPLQTFTLQVARPGLASSTNCLGSKIDSLALSLASKQGLTAKTSLVFQDMEVEPSPTSAVLSTKNPYIFEQGFCAAYFAGEGLAGTGASLISCSISINNNLLKDYFVAGNGNLVRAFPEQKRTISGSVQLGFESAAEITAFNAAAAGGALPSVSLVIPLQSTDLIGATSCPWSITLYLPKVYLSDYTPNDDSSKMITQAITFTAAESTPGASDQVTAYVVGGMAAKF